MSNGESDKEHQCIWKDAASQIEEAHNQMLLQMDSMEAVIKRQHEELVRLKNPMPGREGELLESNLAYCMNALQSDGVFQEGNCSPEFHMAFAKLVQNCAEMRAREKAAHERVEKIKLHTDMQKAEWAKAVKLPVVEVPKAEGVKTLGIGSAVDTGKQQFVIGQIVLVLHPQNIMSVIFYDLEGKHRSVQWYAPIPSPMKPKQQEKPQ